MLEILDVLILFGMSPDLPPFKARVLKYDFKL